MKFCTVTRDGLIDSMMVRLGYEKSDPADADLLMFPGGEDVSPGLYHAEKHPRTYCNPDRDARESLVFRTYHDRRKIGICRGGQFLNVMNRGRMFQDVTNHTRSHVLLYRNENDETEKYTVTSTHHQMMIPAPKALLWGTARESTYRDRSEPSKVPVTFGIDRDDIEIVFYPRTKSLCFQPHPEYGGKDDTLRLFERCLARFIAASK